MSLTAQVVPDPSLTLIVSSPGSHLAHAILEYHREHGSRVVSATHIPPRISADIKSCFCLTSIKYLAEDAEALQSVENTVLVASFPGRITHREQEVIKLILRHYPHVKIALIPVGPHDLPVIVERLMYFAFDQSIRQARITSVAIIKEPDHVARRRASAQRRLPTLRQFYLSIVGKPSRFVIIVLILVFVAHTIFLIPLGVALGLAGVQASRMIGRTGDETPRQQVVSEPFSYALALLGYAEGLYNPIRRGWLFVGASALPERIFDVTQEVIRLYTLAQDSRARADIVLSKMLDPKAVAQDQILEQIHILKNNLTQARDSVRTIQSQLPAPLLAYHDLNTKLDQVKDLSTLALQGLDHTDSILARDSERLYVVLLANDREMRPGGGFIGSFILIKLKNMQVQEWKLYDVYDADGQLKARIAPPEPISTYLQQPYYFLRDSAFTPDHPTNAIVASDFLQKELGITQLDGAVVVTFASIEHLLQDIGPIYLSEYQETITSENVYIKTQLSAEHDFFPGSSQKKDFLQALMTQLFIKIQEPKSAFDALSSLADSLNQKRIAVYVEDPAVQSLLDELYWSGRQIAPGCIDRNVPPASTCIPLYLYPVEANLGVNKANAFVRRDYDVKVRVLTDTQEIETELITHFSNDSEQDLYPGGDYRNYYQLFLPPDIKILSIRIGDTLATDPDIQEDKYTRIGLWITVPAQGTLDVAIKYRTLTTLPPQNSQIQIMFQKQIGLPSSHVSFKFAFPSGYTVSETNFKPLAVGQVVGYNSTIDSDKFYFIHFE